MLKRVFLSLLATILLIALAGFAYWQFNKSPQVFEPSLAGLYNTEPRLAHQDSIRQTTQGRVIGFADSYNTFAWLGIPYAAAPLGDLRWRAPQAGPVWQGLRETIDYGSLCVQFWGLLTGRDGERDDLLGEEDCLSLNIWSPRDAQRKTNSNAKKLPVMFWIHGGGNDSGTSEIYQGHNLAGNKEVVVVTLNYRVGFLGWFSHEAIRDTAANPADASGNFGTLDIIQALKWVQNNISQFGGDPNNVTIFGESAGGRNVYSLIASPLAKGLFHKAISQSGTVDTTLLTLAEDFDDNKLKSEVSGLKNSSNGLISLVLKDLYPDETKAQIRQRIKTYSSSELLKILRKFDAKRLMKLASDASNAPGYIRVARILRDGHVIPKESLLYLFQDPNKYNSVPMMVGTNRDEQKAFMVRNPDYVDNLFGILPRIKDHALYNRVNDYVSINWKAGAVDEPAKIISQTDAAAFYGYRFDWDESPSNWLADLPELVGAAHGFEVGFVFGDFTGGIPLDFMYDKNNAQGRKELALTMMDYWAAFAHTGNPGKGLSGQQNLWRPWKTEGENLMILDTLADGGSRMAEIRNNVADIKARLSSDDVITDQRKRCEAFATLFLHGYQTSDFWNAQEYAALGCEAYPVGEFRAS